MCVKSKQFIKSVVSVTVCEGQIAKPPESRGRGASCYGYYVPANFRRVKESAKSALGRNQNKTEGEGEWDQEQV
jgi:hypothetical protein